MHDRAETMDVPLANRQKAPGSPLNGAFEAALHHVITRIRPNDALQRQMRARIEELSADNRRKDEVLAIVSHELRSPLASIHNAVRFLSRQAEETPARQQMYALLERQVQRMTLLVDDLLDASRIANGRLQLRCERIDLRVVVTHAIETVIPVIRARKQVLTVTSPDAPVWLQADSGRLEQVVVNLLANAVTYTDVGGELAVWLDTEESQAVIHVRDSGIGITPDMLPYVFDLFKQVNEIDPRSKSGLGIGLAVVRDLVELHGGSVSAASDGSGQGSEFIVRLPRND